MERLTAVRVYNIAILLGAALLLPAAGGTQALSDTREKDLAEQDFTKETTLGIRAMEPPESEISEKVEPGIKVFSTSAWVQWGPRQAQVGPEEDRDHLHHPQDNAREADAHRPPRMLSLEVQSCPEDDRDHLYHS